MSEEKKYWGHGFFPNVMGLYPKKIGSKTRHNAAQLYVRYAAYHNNLDFAPTENRDLDEYYYENTEFDLEKPLAKRFRRVLTMLENIFSHIESVEPPKNHAATHLIFLADALMDNCVENKWTSGLGKAYAEFSNKVSKARKDKNSANDYWERYGQYAETSSRKPPRIRRRNDFFYEKILRFMEKEGALVVQDDPKAFSVAARQYIFFLDRERCLACHKFVVWREAAVLHVKPLEYGGETEIDNGALVHSNCLSNIGKWHRESLEKEFRKKRTIPIIYDDKEKRERTRHLSWDEFVRRGGVPDGTKARAFYNETLYEADIKEGGNWLGDGWTAKTPAGAIKAAIEEETGREISLNGWVIWEVKRPQDENWGLLQKFREELSGASDEVSEEEEEEET